MDKAKLTATILGIITFIVVIAQNLLGLTLLADTDPGTLAGSLVTVIMAVYAAWKTISDYINERRAKAAEARNAELEKQIISLEQTMQFIQTKYEKAIAGLK